MIYLLSILVLSAVIKYVCVITVGMAVCQHDYVY